MSQQSYKSLKLNLSHEGETAVLKVSGSAGASEAEKFRTRLDEIVSAKPPVLVLDLTEMEFICSLGLSAIIAAHLKARHHQGQIRLVNPQAHVQNLLDVTRLTKVFAIYPSLQGALA